MESKAYIFDPRPAFPLVVSARQYWTPECSRDDPDALTLVFAHGLTGTNAIAEPVLEDIFALLRLSEQIKIRDVWGIEAPNHGEAAILNERELMWGYNIVFPWEEYARAIHLFLAGHGRGVDVDFSSRKLVGVGACVGSTAIILSQTYQPALNYVSMVLLEPAFNPFPTDPESRVPSSLYEPLLQQKDIWPNREQAGNEIRQHPIWTESKDTRAVEQLIRHELRELPTAEYPDITEGVTLKCTKFQQAATVQDRLSRAKAFRYLPHLCTMIPVHLVFGTVPTPWNNVPAEAKEFTMAEGTQGRQASVQYIANVSHAFVLTHPEQFADAVWNALCMPRSCAFAQRLRSRL